MVFFLVLPARWPLPMVRRLKRAGATRQEEEAARLEHAVAAAWAGGARTQDIAAPGDAVGNTAALGDAVLAALEASP